MKRRVGIVLATVTAISGLWIVAPTSAFACKQYPCPPACKLQPPVVVHENGTITDQPPLVCYY